jgi:2-iminobutanoate/2-iminopropanoate deaminase
MSAITPMHTDAAPAAVGPYAQAVAAGGMLYLSGQIGLDPATGKLAGQGFEAQAKQVLANVQAVLATAGLTPADMVNVDVFLTSMADFPVFNALYADFLGEHRPARATIEVAGLPLGALVEVRCVALLKS